MRNPPESDRETVVNVLAGISEHVMSDGEIGGRSRAVPPVRASFNSAIEKNVRSRTLGACFEYSSSVNT